MASTVVSPKPTLASHEKRIGDLESDVCRHEVFIVGNGSIGAKTDLELLKTAVKEIRESMKHVTTALYTLAASIIGAIIIWFITVYLPTHI